MFQPPWGVCVNQVARVSASVGRVCESGDACFSLREACV